MATSVFDLFAKLSLDSTDFNKGLDSAKSAMGTLGKGVSAGIKVAGAAVAAATTAVVGFGVSSVKTGMEFDKSMSQVAATMGMSVEEINTEGSAAQQTFQQLNQFAQEMGRTTAFSASEAADALNYMALAGYDADTSMKMLPNVLNLAAAGGMELATASDMVTDTQSALGLSLEETTELVDKMAKASSKSNTSVQQLGEAMLTIGGTAKNLSGGTTELSQALGLLADNGIKGAEGGTALRNILLNLTPKSEDAAKAMKEIGLDAYDAEGNMRPLKDIFQDLNKGMEGMTQEQKTNILANIFNKVDLKSVNALMATNVERWDELSTAIEDSKGAAATMAETQLDNLAGDVTLLKSAFEGAQIAVSNELTPSVRNFVQLGTDAISNFASAVESGGLSAGIASIGKSLAQGITDITVALPDAINAGIELMGAVAQGMAENAPAIGQALMDAAGTITETGVSLMQSLADGMATFDWAETATNICTWLKDAFSSDTATGFIEAGSSIIGSLASGIGQSIPELATSAVDIVVGLVNELINNSDVIIQGAIDLILGMKKGIEQGKMSIISAIPSLVGSLAEALIRNAPAILSAIIQYGVLSVQTIVQLFPTIINAVVQGIISLVQAVANEGPQFLAKTGEILNDVLTNITTWLAGLPTTIAHGIGVMVGSFASALADLIPKAKEKFDETMEKVKDFLKKFKEEAPKAAKQFVKDLPENLKQLPAKMKESGKKIVDALKTGIANAWDSFISWIKQKALSIVSSFLSGVKEGAGGGKGDSKGSSAKSASVSSIASVSSMSAAGISSIGNSIVLASRKVSEDEEIMDYDKLAGAMVRAFEQSDFTMEVDGREFGRVVRKAVAY